MKKILTIALVILLMVSCLFVLTGCDKGGETEQEEAKNVEKFEIESNFGKLSFELPKDTGYELKVDTNKGTLTHSENGSKIEFFIMNTSKSSILMKEKDFSSSSYEGYAEIEIAGCPAYTIKKTGNFSVQYGVLLDEYDKDHGKYHGLKIVVSKSSLQLDDFDPAAFVESDAFKTLLGSLKFEAAAPEEKEENKDVMKNYGEFESRTDGISDKDGLLFIKKYESPNPELYKAEQRNNNVGIDNYLWYISDKAKFKDSGIQVRIFPKTGTFNNLDEYRKKKGDMYTWGKTKIGDVEYDTFVFSNSTKAEKYSEYVSGAFMVGDRVVEFSYNMYAEVPDQDLGPKFFKQIVDSIEYSKEFK